MHPQQRPVTRSLVTYAQSLPLVATPSTRYDLCGLAKDLLAPAAQNLSANNVVVPILQTFNVLLEADAFDPLPEQPSGLDRCVFFVAEPACLLIPYMPASEVCSESPRGMSRG